MKKMKYRGNATEINKMPWKVRYVWIVKYKDGSVGTCMTYQTMSKITVSEVDEFKVVDLKHDVIRPLVPGMIVQLANEWREHYFDYDWLMSVEYILQF